MFRILTVSFIVVPILEIWVLTQVAGGVGWLNAISLVIVVSAVGAWMVKQQGLGIIRRVEQRLAEGSLPSTELVSGRARPSFRPPVPRDADKRLVREISAGDDPRKMPQVLVARGAPLPQRELLFAHHPQ